MCFSMEKVKTLDFLDRFVASDLKVGRYRQLIELMKLCEYSRTMSFLDVGQRLYYKRGRDFNIIFSQKRHIDKIMNEVNQHFYAADPCPMFHASKTLDS